MAKTYSAIKTISDQIKNATVAASNTAAIVGGNLGDIVDKIQEVDGAKVPTTTKVNGKALSGDISITKDDLGLGDVPSDIEAIESSLADKVSLTATETIGGAKTFSVSPIIPTPDADMEAATKKYVDDSTVGISGNETISGVKTFQSSPVIPAPTTDLQAATKKYVDDTKATVDAALLNKADLVGGKIPTSQLPAYVDDVLEYANLAAFPSTGETGKIYVALDTNLTYRWSGTAYVEISKSLGLGETSSTAYRGDRGKTAYDHSQASGNPHGTTASQIPNTPAGTIAATTVQAAINELDGDVAQVRADLNIFNYMYPSVQSAKRITTDLGVIRSRSNFNDLTNRFVDLLDNTKFLYCPQLAFKLRTSGITNYITKLYDIGSAMIDATQTTALSQPFLTGNIAPNEKYAVKNPNGASTYLTHTPISFLNTDKWTVSTMLTDFCHAIDTSGCYAGNGNVNSNIYLRSGGANRLRFLSSAAVEYLFNINNSMVGKNSMITLVANGLSGLSLYINGRLFQSIASTDTSAVFSQFVNGATVGASLFAGLISYHAVRNIALSPTQIDEEYQYIRSLYPEMRSVKIGTQEWTVVNAELTCTPMGSVMPEVKVNADWANSTTIYNSVYASTSGTTEQKEYAAVKAAAMWCHYNNDPALGAIYGKLYNWFAVKLLQMDIDYYNAANPTSPWGWRVPTNNDIIALSTYLGGDAVSGGKIKKEGTIYWLSPNVGADNSTGWSAIASGYRNQSGGYLTLYNNFYPTTIDKSQLRYIRFSDSGLGGQIWNTDDVIRGLSLILIKS